MKYLPALSTFSDTSVDVASLKTYLLDCPRYLDCGYETGASDYAKDLLNRMDFFEFHLRRLRWSGLSAHGFA